MNAAAARLPIPPDFRPASIAAVLIAAVALIGGAIRVFEGQSASSPQMAAADPNTADALARKLPTSLEHLPPEIAADGQFERIIGGTREASRQKPKATPTADMAVLLLAAREDPKGRITASEFRGELTVQVGTHVFCDSKSGPREAARWRDAIDRLQMAGLIEGVGSETSGHGRQFAYFRVTKAGYFVADGKSEN
jgi:hypothetical protein